MIYRPSLCIIAQGTKQFLCGDQFFEYRSNQSLVVSVEMPAVGQVVEATPEDPYLALSLEIDAPMLRQVLEEMETPPKSREAAGLGVFVQELEAPLIDSLVRLISLLETPGAIRILYPAIMREISFWLLTGENAGEFCRLLVPNGHIQRITGALHAIRSNFSDPINVEELALMAGMSPSSFYQHFKAITSITPLQYQKQFRLVEARRLLTADGASVATAAYQVGYKSVSQFSREYARTFGVPPKRDALSAMSAS